MNHREVGQHPHRLIPCRMNGFVFARGYGKKFGQFYPERHGNVGILTHDTAIFNGKQRKLIFQGCHFTDVSHAPFLLFKSERIRFRLIR